MFVTTNSQNHWSNALYALTTVYWDSGTVMGNLRFFLFFFCVSMSEFSCPLLQMPALTLAPIACLCSSAQLFTAVYNCWHSCCKQNAFFLSVCPWVSGRWTRFGSLVTIYNCYCEANYYCLQFFRFCLHCIVCVVWLLRMPSILLTKIFLMREFLLRNLLLLSCLASRSGFLYKFAMVIVSSNSYSRYQKLNEPVKFFSCSSISEGSLISFAPNNF